MHEHKVSGKLKKQIRKIITAKADVLIAKLESSADPDCALCDDDEWWPANGFTEQERKVICGPDGLNCPGWGGDAARS